MWGHQSNGMEWIQAESTNLSQKQIHLQWFYMGSPKINPTLRFFLIHSSRQHPKFHYQSQVQPEDSFDTNSYICSLRVKVFYMQLSKLGMRNSQLEPKNHQKPQNLRTDYNTFLIFFPRVPKKDPKTWQQMPFCFQFQKRKAVQWHFATPSFLCSAFCRVEHGHPKANRKWSKFG